MFTSIHLLDARYFPAVAARNGIRQTARALTFTGRLEPITVGRRTYYRWRDILAVMPDWARSLHAAVAVEPVVSIEHRAGMVGHTVTVEHATALVARRNHIAPGDWIVVERSDGTLTALATIPDWDVPEEFAEAYADIRGARYLPAGGAR